MYLIGIEIVRKALTMPCMTIAQNAGVDASIVVDKVSKGVDNFGYDALNDEYVNMIEKGIIDPTKVSYHIILLLFITYDSQILSSLLLSHLFKLMQYLIYMF